MQHDDLDIEIHNSPPKFNVLDNALNELGMLATCSSSKQDYLREIQNNRVINMLSINTRYVSNVSIGFRVRPVAPHVRYKPYNPPKREERHRTRSENNDEGTHLEQAVDNQLTSTLEDMTTNLKKAKSLESIIAEGNVNVDFGTIAEVEIVSNSIKKLTVDESD